MRRVCISAFDNCCDPVSDVSAGLRGQVERDPRSIVLIMENLINGEEKAKASGGRDYRELR